MNGAQRLGEPLGDAAVRLRRSAPSVRRSRCSVVSVIGVLPGEGELVDVDVARGEAGPGVLEVEVPHPQERLVEAELEHPLGRRRGTPRPTAAASRRSAGPSRSGSAIRSAGVVAGDLVDHLHRGQEAAGEDVLVDPRVGVAGGEHPVVRHRDRLDGDLAAGGEHPVDGLEVGLPVLPADGLDHLDRDDGVVLALHVAVVAQLDRDLVGAEALCAAAAATRWSPSACCSVDRVTEVTVAPRRAARMQSSPQPEPISSTRVPWPTPASSSSRSILRPWALLERRWPGRRRGRPSKSAEE